MLAAAERRHYKALRELELEKERKSRYAAQGDDVLALLEKEREKLTQQVTTFAFVVLLLVILSQAINNFV